MINYFNFKKFGNEYLITNDLGRHSFVDSKVLKALIQDDSDSLLPEIRDKLRNDFFLTGPSRQEYLEQITPHMRDFKNHLLRSTGLFIFVLTNTCNLNCVYCQAQSENSKSKGLMTKEIAKLGVDIALQSPTPDIIIEFQGGEPLLNFDTIKTIIEYADNNSSGKSITYNLVSNLSLLTEPIADYLVEHNVQISVSLDGNDYVHNTNRPFRLGGGSFEAACKGIKLLQRRNITLGAIQTTTRYSLSHYKKIIDTYIELGFKSIFLRPLTQLGFANDHWEQIGYSAEEFLKFYKNAMDYILKLNSKDMVFSEGHASIFLKKIIGGYSQNYMELRSPCGASVGQAAIYYDGNIYTCDEGRMVAEMGDPAFRIGDVFSSTYNDLIDSGVCKAVCASSCLESLPHCCDCVYQPFCGVCPVINYALNKDLFSKNYQNTRCKIYSGILDYIFCTLQSNNHEYVDVFERWIN
ncbi:His-Xaa-Ser system radical SAM maturase HxsB [Butyrivibrio fibrisolvens]|uniref:His-Xaa-Ser system radical SAM maturase HxsB n=1 Tax=Butyrivibrio fibrisolvens TaxID=831 RepID=UPI0003FC2184|nr:His-Xaa-Ser system radical SAM maturase HxsB [Butyrivibrio fibrisolvens]